MNSIIDRIVSHAPNTASASNDENKQHNKGWNDNPNEDGFEFSSRFVNYDSFRIWIDL